MLKFNPDKIPIGYIFMVANAHFIMTSYGAVEISEDELKMVVKT